jgi:hypothetical protein
MILARDRERHISRGRRTLGRSDRIQLRGPVADLSGGRTQFRPRPASSGDRYRFGSRFNRISCHMELDLTELENHNHLHSANGRSAHLLPSQKLAIGPRNAQIPPPPRVAQAESPLKRYPLNRHISTTRSADRSPPITPIHLDS